MNCKPGDLAIVIKDEDFPQNIGLLVKVVGTPNPEDYAPGTISCYDWECESAAPIWGWDNPEQTKASVRVGLISIPDDELQPLRGLPVRENISQSAPLERAKPAEVEA